MYDSYMYMYCLGYMFVGECAGGVECSVIPLTLSYRMFSLTCCRESTPPEDRRIIVFYDQLKS